MKTPELILARLETLKPCPRNPRLHSRRQIRQIAESIRSFGFTNPLLIDETGEIIAGHGRFEAAASAGFREVPCIRVEGLDPARKAALRLADNKLALNSSWSVELLQEHMLEIIDADVELEVTGFEAPEANLILRQDWAPVEADPQDERIPEPQEGPAVTRRGDLWRIGRHHLLCGDALDAADYERLLGEEKAQMVFTDPPYNVPVSGHVSGLGRVRHREFAMASGEMTEPQFVEFLRTAAARLVAHSRDGALHFICMDWRHLSELLAMGREAYSQMKNLCVWTKDNAGMGSLYRSQHELVAVFKVGTGPHVNNVELGRHGRYRTNVWSYPGVNGFGGSRKTDLADHPTVKPVAMLADAMLDCSRPGGLVLDPFAGSGTVLVAAERAGRRAAAIELDPGYVDVAIRRVAAQTGLQATLADGGGTFEEVAAARGRETAA